MYAPFLQPFPADNWEYGFKKKEGAEGTYGRGLLVTKQEAGDTYADDRGGQVVCERNL